MLWCAVNVSFVSSGDEIAYRGSEALLQTYRESIVANKRKHSLKDWCRTSTVIAFKDPLLGLGRWGEASCWMIYY